MTTSEPSTCVPLARLKVGPFTNPRTSVSDNTVFVSCRYHNTIPSTLVIVFVTSSLPQDNPIRYRSHQRRSQLNSTNGRTCIQTTGLLTSISSTSAHSSVASEVQTQLLLHPTKESARRTADACKGVIISIGNVGWHVTQTVPIQYRSFGQNIASTHFGVGCQIDFTIGDEVFDLLPTSWVSSPSNSPSGIFPGC